MIEHETNNTPSFARNGSAFVALVAALSFVSPANGSDGLVELKDYIKVMRGQISAAMRSAPADGGVYVTPIKVEVKTASVISGAAEAKVFVVNVEGEIENAVYTTVSFEIGPNRVDDSWWKAGLNDGRASPGQIESAVTQLQEKGLSVGPAQGGMAAYEWFTPGMTAVPPGGGSGGIAAQQLAPWMMPYYQNYQAMTGPEVRPSLDLTNPDVIDLLTESGLIESPDNM